MRYISLLAFAFFATMLSLAQETGPENTTSLSQFEKQFGSISSEEATDMYKSIVRKLLTGDPTQIDFTELRFYYSKSKYYDPYDSTSWESDVSQMLKLKKYDELLSFGEEHLLELISLVNFHYYMKMSYKAIGKEDYYRWHNYVHYQLTFSIISGGDGLSMETCYKVISVQEEYAALGYLQLDTKGQGLVEENGHYYDVFELEDGRNIYFNIDSPYTILKRQLEES